MAQNKRFGDKLLWSRCRTQSARMTLSSTVTAALADGKIQIRYKTMLQDPRGVCSMLTMVLNALVPFSKKISI